ncbi:T9SS type B sorting domain-containing protein [Sungkyunkwania multivorans]|uniref:T9SS type B sorting domain-containing protein n=1 Tax=Sungkyunkwania multivorans TaxID=1173618 RepID=A0ABW3D2F0_9FLAO
MGINKIEWTNRSFGALILIGLFFLIGLSQTKAQLGFCSGDKGAPIFEENFGIGSQNGPPLPNGVTTYSYVDAAPQDGSYTISSQMGQLGSWHVTGDRTPGDVNGKAFIVNASFTADQFYSREIADLCENTFYEFSAWLLNVYDLDASACSNGGIPINVRFEIWDETDTALLASGDTGEIHATSSPTWERYGLVFQTAAGQSTVILKMRNNGDGGCGNDLAIDDISFSSCGDTTVINSSIAGANIFCASEAPITATLTATPDFSVFPVHFFQWQESIDGISYTDIVGETTSSYTTPPLSASRYFRVNVASDPINLGSPFCSSLSEPFQIEIFPVPTKPVSRGDKVICIDESIPSLMVDAAAEESVRWFRFPTGGTPIANGTTFLSSTAGTYYAEAFIPGINCVSQDRTAVSLTINPTPTVLPDVIDATLCTGQETKFLSAGTTGQEYVWSTGEESEVIEISAPGTYTVTIIDPMTRCDVSRTFSVSGIDPPVFGTPPFTVGASVVLETTNTGDFEFSLDGINYQDSNIFPYIEGGIYTAYARNKEGCDPATIQFFHLRIPEFFTPNNDGYNDSFSIRDLSFFGNSTIHIFDRFGKLLKSGPGTNFNWDGTVLNQPLPSGDYWYRITIDGNEFKGHFSLKR